LKEDYNLKIKINNILLSLGYYTRLELKLAGYSSNKKLLELTDLDVLGIKITPNFNTDYVLADCTSRSRVIESPIQRVFWLKGVMELFGGKQGYLVLDTDQKIPEIQKQTSAKLGVIILNKENLLGLENKLINKDIKSLNISNKNSWENFDNKINKINSGFYKIINFRKYNYWLNKQNKNVLTIMLIFEKIKNLINEDSSIHKALIIDLMSLLSISLLNFCRFLVETNPDDIQKELKAYLFGGHREYKEKEKAVSVLKEIIKNQKQKKLFDDEIKLDPEYLPELFDIILRWTNKPIDSCIIPNYLQFIIFEKVMNNNINFINSFENNFSEITKKMTRDLATLIINNSLLSKKIFEELF